MSKGWICLDIDGTITSTIHSVPEKVANYLEHLSRSGWQLVFITGRTYSFAHGTLQRFSFPYYFSVQNGADLLYMPGKELIHRCYLPGAVAQKIEALYEEMEEDFLIYSGYERGDFCYYRPSRLSPRVKSYLQVIQGLSSEPWKEVEHFSFPLGEYFPLIKCFGTKEAMFKMYERLSKIEEIQATCIKDPLSTEGGYVNLVTDKLASKGNALDFLKAKYGADKPFIAAGDDCNDVSMLRKADVRIVMETAPHEVLSLADIVSVSAEREGIIDALEKAISQV